jgi:hypothetical protein
VGSATGLGVLKIYTSPLSAIRPRFLECADYSTDCVVLAYHQSSSYDTD